MFFENKKAAQPEFWIAADQVVASAQTGFYEELEETLESFTTVPFILSRLKCQ